MPDRIFIFPFGTVVFIEFKAPGKKPTDNQVRELHKILLNRGNAFVVDDVESVIFTSDYKGITIDHNGKRLIDYFLQWDRDKNA